MTEQQRPKVSGNTPSPSRGDSGTRRPSSRRRSRSGHGNGPRPLSVSERGSIDHLHAGFDEASYVVFDLESTGGNPDKNGITEIFALRYHQGRIKDTFYSLVNPKISIPPIVRKMTGINNAMVKDAPLIEEIMPRFVEFIKDDVLVSHNTIGDMKFLRYFSEKTTGAMITNYYMCTHLLVEKLLPHMPDKSLKGLSIHLKLHGDGDHHRAETDTYLTLELFKVLLKELKQRRFDSVIQAIRFQGDFESSSRLGWAVDRSALERVGSRPGVFRLVDHQKQTLFLSSAPNLVKEVRKLERFQDLPKQLMKSVLASTAIETTEASSFFEATLLEAEHLAEQSLRFDPSQWHQRTASFFQIVPQGEQWLCTIGPLGAGARAMRGPLRGGRDGQLMLERVAEVFGLTVGKRGVVLDESQMQTISSFLQGDQGNPRLGILQWPLLLLPSFRQQYRVASTLRKKLRAMEIPAELKPLDEGTGILLMPRSGHWDVYGLLQGIPVQLDPVKGDAEETLNDPSLRQAWRGTLQRELAQQGALLVSAREANLLNCVFWWLTFGLRRNGGRFIPLAEI